MPKSAGQKKIEKVVKTTKVSANKADSIVKSDPLIDACRAIQRQAKHGTAETLTRAILKLNEIIGKVD